MSEQAYLLVDIGNSRLKWKLWKPCVNKFSCETQYVDYKQTGHSVKDILDTQWGSIEENITQVMAVNVAGQAIANEMTEWCSRQWKIEPVFAQTGASYKSMTNGYLDFSELGADRWLTVIAAYECYPDKPVIVIDCGTAITIDVIDSSGKHHAGPIIPGQSMMIQALATSTADLNNIPLEQSSASVFVDSTEKAIFSGVVFATSGSVDTIVRDILHKLKNEAPGEVTMLVTGGAAGTIMPQTHIKDYKVEPDLVFMGLLRLATENQ